MLRAHGGTLNSAWYDCLESLLKDLEPLGHYMTRAKDGQVNIGSRAPLERAKNEHFWRSLHEDRHLIHLRAHADWIRDFEARHSDIFADMASFQPSSVQPTLEIIDFDNQRHLDIAQYFMASQTVSSKKLVGRRMGLLIWDEGQTGHRPLLGLALLGSARYAQKLRDRYFGWPPAYQKTSVHFDPAGRDIRIAGLNRIMQLSVACALPPYRSLKGAWLAALAPFTPQGQIAFERTVKNDEDPDLASIVTTTGLGVSGMPFRGHRIGQLGQGVFIGAPGSKGDVYRRVAPAYGESPLRASFRDLVTPATYAKATALFHAEQPLRARIAYGRSAEHCDRAALSFAMRRLGLHSCLFDGNDMGVHVGMLGADTLNHLRNGTPRIDRPRLDWGRATTIWTGCFLPGPTTAFGKAGADHRAEHDQARKRRTDRARATDPREIRLSSLL